MENSPISCVSPIREEVITCAIPEESDVVSTPRRTFKRKSFLLSPGAKASRYASCSNLADLNESDILNTSSTSIQSAASEFKLPKRKRKSLFGSIFRKPKTRSMTSKRRSIEVKLDDDIVIWEEAIPSPKRRRSGILRRLTMSKKSDL
ncbi:unnamed protein product [Oikopleura dioica]|uniref:Uncharacterized protein n=1 Tax=Oikopleura dioica TaxID=34765 RepID=E4X8L0_OIKDI|nr:unnamed protein product [Oikopleura dioica]